MRGHRAKIRDRCVKPQKKRKCRERERGKNKGKGERERKIKGLTLHATLCIDRILSRNIRLLFLEVGEEKDEGVEKCGVKRASVVIRLNGV